MPLLNWPRKPKRKRKEVKGNDSLPGKFAGGSNMPSIKGIPGPYRLFFYSFDCGEPKHVHVQREKMLCKFWLEPMHLAKNDGFAPKELNAILKLIGRNLPKILEAWHEHCG